MKLKQLFNRWLIGVKHRTPEEQAEREYKGLMKRMANTNIRTYTGQTFIGRNDSCYCGSRRKFKHCCWVKHAVIEEDTEEVLRSREKVQKYFDKHRKVPR